LLPMPKRPPKPMKKSELHTILSATWTTRESDVGRSTLETQLGEIVEPSGRAGDHGGGCVRWLPGRHTSAPSLCRQFVVFNGTLWTRSSQRRRSSRVERGRSPRARSRSRSLRQLPASSRESLTDKCSASASQRRSSTRELGRRDDHPTPRYQCARLRKLRNDPLEANHVRYCPPRPTGRN
jgi:hypothetical protein